MARNWLILAVWVIVLVDSPAINAQNWATYIDFHSRPTGNVERRFFGEIQGVDSCGHGASLCQYGYGYAGSHAVLNSSCSEWDCPQNAYRQLIKGWRDTTYWILAIENLFGSSEFQITFEPESTMELGSNQLFLIDSLASPVAIVNMRDTNEYIYYGSRSPFSRMYIVAIGHETTAVSVEPTQYPPNESTILLAYPNPATDFVTVSSSEEVILLDCLGQQIAKFRLGLEISSLPRGVYFLRTPSSSGRFIKQ